MRSKEVIGENLVSKTLSGWLGDMRKLEKCYTFSDEVFIRDYSMFA